ncbi:MAG: hypothetical protein K8S23_13860 [Candidatus Cloacimonetes bacterium]|nr:hypothetical protein [Candidatus Cloacimonadota bacterium]
MGQQQTLLVLLSIMIVIVAISIGIKLFNSYSINSIKQNCLSELNYMRARSADYYKTSQYMGGSSYGSYKWDSNSLAAYIGMDYNDTNGVETVNAIYTITVLNGDITFLADPKDQAFETNIQMDYNVDTQVTTLTYPE